MEGLQSPRGTDYHGICRAGRSSKGAIELEGGSGAFRQHFIKTLKHKLHDPSLLSACPAPPSVEVFKHIREQPASGAHPDAWGSSAHSFSAPSGAHKLLSADYGHLDAAPGRQRQAAAHAQQLALQEEAEDVPDPPLYMRQAKWVGLP
jgi:hypothetical protein